ncbi:hypothetical protein F5B22DRAFT_637340 [Xylaria bambusicola]|uniref:uncharacterized protein n=1 Tax=Xylaria bambusicola TaxID=326684 RepID=UPI002007A134|nr:uncharacterized protein F5B22DRAFT_637340 [Xylaria bambusicola]KAI0513215.1 hypothetical protein F5B22DRAFT_637340 [Xylaria bambusicola]
MSRALDTVLLSQLKSEDPKPAYIDLSTLLTNLPGNGLLEIEFLGPSHPLEPGVNFLQDENAIAIPKLRLVQAFFVAHKVIKGHLENASAVITNDVIAASSIVLLMDPEHLTAANIRKRFLSASGNMTNATLKKERQFVDTLLTARLHRHTKSPTLWSHRRWLVATCLDLSIPWDIRDDIKNVVMVAGERHPRNYVAWQHARFLLHHDPSLSATVAVDAKAFCLKNHSDISGWTFLSDCIARIQDETDRALVRSSVLDDVLTMTQSFRWTNESVWAFLRTIVARECVSEQDLGRFLATNDGLSASMPRNAAEWNTLIRAREWCVKHRLPKVT